MKVRCEKIEQGVIPSERVVKIRTVDGDEEEVVVSDRQTSGSHLVEVSEVHTEGSKVLVELPRESASGKWRLWVAKSQVEA